MLDDSFQIHSKQGTTPKSIEEAANPGQNSDFFFPKPSV